MFKAGAASLPLKMHSVSRMANDLEKEAPARASLQYIKDGQVVGLGAGSTAAYFIKLLGDDSVYKSTYELEVHLSRVLLVLAVLAPIQAQVTVRIPLEPGQPAITIFRQMVSAVASKP